MSRAILLAGLLAVSVAAQEKFAVDGFKYVGCVQANPSVFPVKTSLTDSYTVAECQAACTKIGSYAAASKSGCVCNDPASKADIKYDVLEPSQCTKACKPDDDKAGQCGGPCSPDGQHLYNLYQRVDSASDPTKAQPIHANKAADVQVATVMKTVTACAPDVTDCPLRNKPVAPPVETKAVVLPDPASPAKTSCGCKETAKPVAPPKPCAGPECNEPPLNAKFPPHTSGMVPANTSIPILISQGPSRPASTVMTLLGLGAFVLAFGMS
jgi:hypothetical protein